MYDVAIVGAGPAALIAAQKLLEFNSDINLIIFDQGSDFMSRDKLNPFAVANGFGGAGLFTDGKLSLPPSASYIWSRLNRNNVILSYNYIQKWLKEYDVVLPDISENWFEKYIGDEIKEYDSIKLTYEQSEAIIRDFERKLNSKVILNTRIINIEEDPYRSFYILKSNDANFEAKYVIIATGKSGNGELLSNLEITVNSTYEIGLRIEVPNEMFLPYDNSKLDYKLIFKNKDYEVRTFCCCKDGRVVKSKFDSFFSFNGMVTEDKSGSSNIGLTIRSSKRGIANEMYDIICSKGMSGDRLLLKDYFSGEEIFGEKFDDIFKQYIGKVVDINRISDPRAFVYFPCIEKVGEFADEFLSNSLRIQGHNLWVIGDATYKFRGLMAAFISGYFAALEIIALGINLPIKISSAEEAKIVFTAQSKEFFYCKDVICEYALKNNAVPINPFQVFNYFLNDRVDRTLIRRGNNNLILRCDELWVFGRISDGVLFEIKLAKEHGIPIRYFSLGTYLIDIREIPIEQVKFDSELHAKQVKKGDLYAFLKGESPGSNYKQLSFFDD